MLSREEQARIEVGYTDVSSRVAWALTAGFLVLVAALPAAELWGSWRSPEPGPWARLRIDSTALGAADGVTGAVPFVPAPVVAANRALLAAFSDFEAALEDRSPVGRRLRPPAQAVLTRWLGAGNERVYVGRDGWLFFRADVEYATGRGFLDPAQMARRVVAASEYEAPPAPDPRAAIRQFARDLQARGVRLIVVPTPVKPVVHPDRLARAEVAAPVHNLSYAALVEELRRDGILVFDPTPHLVGARSGGSPQYLATDTHWRPEAMQRVAEALAAYVRAHVALPPVPSSNYTVEPREARHTGDTAAMLDLPAGQTLYPPETVTLRFVAGPTGDPWRPSRNADVLVLGDSFSNIYSLAAMGWGESAGFIEQLSVALDRPLDRIVQNDQGARATRDLLARELTGAADRLAGKRLVIWQFAVRELAFGDWAVRPLP